MWNKAKTILLASNQKENIGDYIISLHVEDNSLHCGIKLYKSDIEEVNQHLYIINDDVIKEGEICFHSNINEICVADEFMVENPDCKKVIATTDKSLSPKLHKGEIVDNSYPEEFKTILHQIPQSFIEQYITEYNKGNIISDVLVEVTGGYDFDTTNPPKSKTLLDISLNLTINPDNTINIKTVKDSFSREEVTALITKAISETNASNNRNVSMLPSKFIEQNL